MSLFAKALPAEPAAGVEGKLAIEPAPCDPLDSTNRSRFLERVAGAPDEAEINLASNHFPEFERLEMEPLRHPSDFRNR